MHMADALLSPGVGGGMYAASAVAIAYSVTKLKKEDPGESKIPLMAVSGAMVFAAQMINITIPGTGSSGHIGGGILLAALLGPFAGLLAIAAVLVIQCLFFADGGLLALGCNIFNLGVIPCLFVYPLLFKRVLSPSPTAKRIWIASVISVIVALQLGAFGVVLQTTASGVIALPFSAFALLMQPIHLAIGVLEGIITAAILSFVFAARPQILTSAAYAEKNTVKSAKLVIIVFACIAIITGAVLSLFASPNPDGLEWSIEKLTGSTELHASGPVFDAFAAVQERLSFMPDYDFAPVAGIIGAAIVFAAASVAGLLIYAVKKKRKHNRDGSFCVNKESKEP